MFFLLLSGPKYLVYEGQHGDTNSQLSAKQTAGSSSQHEETVIGSISQQKTAVTAEIGSPYKGWEVWDERYKVPPVMLSKQACGKVCTGNKDLYNLLPETYPSNRELFGANRTCAMVSSSKVLDKYEFGAEIDSHDVVLRFNLHPVRDPKREGYKTTHMMVHCGFWSSSEPQYRKLYLIRNRTENMILFFARMHHEIKRTAGRLSDKFFNRYLFPKYTEFLKERKSKLNQTYILNHEFIKRSRDAFEVSSGTKLRYYPSSGFMGLFLLSRTCSSISAYGFSDSELKKDYKFVGKILTHDFAGEHRVMHKWFNYNNPSVNFRILP